MDFHAMINGDTNSEDDNMWGYLPIEPIVKVEELDDNTSDDEIVPSALVEPILLKPDSAEEDEVLLDLKPEPDLTHDSNRSEDYQYNQHGQAWSYDAAEKAIRELKLRASESILQAVRARRRAQLLLGPAGIHKMRQRALAHRHPRFTPYFGLYRP